MELIVKIGADQVGLQRSIEKMKSQFNSMNASVPIGWGGGGGRTPSRLNSGQAAFLAEQEAAMGGGMLQQKTASALAKKGTNLLKGILIGQLMSLIIEVGQILSDKFWEKVYGVSEKATAKILESHTKIMKGVAERAASRASLGSALRDSTLANASPESKKDFLLNEKNISDSELKARKKEFADAKRDFEIARDQDIQTVNGSRRMTAEERLPIVLRMADAERKLFEAREKQIKANDAYMNSVDESIKAELEKKEAIQNEKNERRLNEMQIDKLKPFGADSMAQSGLFTGSSLLFNPAFNVQQEQLNVLRTIAQNTSSQNGGLPAQ